MQGTCTDHGPHLRQDALVIILRRCTEDCNSQPVRRRKPLYRSGVSVSHAGWAICPGTSRTKKDQEGQRPALLTRLNLAPDSAPDLTPDLASDPVPDLDPVSMALFAIRK